MSLLHPHCPSTEGSCPTAPLVSHLDRDTAPQGDTAITTQLQNKTFPSSSSVLHSNPFSSLFPQDIVALRETQAVSVPPPNSEPHQRMKSGRFDKTYFCSTTLTGMNLYSQALNLPLIEFCSDFSTCLPRINVRLIGCSCPSHLTHSLRCLFVYVLLPPDTMLQLFRIKREAPRGAASDSGFNPSLRARLPRTLQQHPAPALHLPHAQHPSQLTPSAWHSSDLAHFPSSSPCSAQHEQSRRRRCQG